MTCMSRGVSFMKKLCSRDTNGRQYRYERAKMTSNASVFQIVQLLPGTVNCKTANHHEESVHLSF